MDIGISEDTVEEKRQRHTCPSRATDGSIGDLWSPDALRRRLWENFAEGLLPLGCVLCERGWASTYINQTSPIDGKNAFLVCSCEEDLFWPVAVACFVDRESYTPHKKSVALER